MKNALNKPINILLADDDPDDRYFFELALKGLPIQANLQTVSDGEKLMKYLSQKTKPLPDILFLDVNMPCKNGVECLKEIRSIDRLRKIPVVMYSTSISAENMAINPQYGASNCLQKDSYKELPKLIEQILQSFPKITFSRMEEYLLPVNRA